MQSFSSFPPSSPLPESPSPFEGGSRRESYLILRKVRIPGEGSKGEVGRFGRLTDVLLLLSPGKGESRILRIAPEIRVENQESGRWSVFDGKGRCLAPAFSDSFCRFGSADFFYREDPSSGGSAARAGGFGRLFLFPQVRLNTAGDVSSFQRRMSESDPGVQIFPAVSVCGGKLQELLRRKNAHTLLFTDEGADRLSEAALLELMRTLAKENLTLFCMGSFPMGSGSPGEGSTPERENTPEWGAVNEGRVAKLMGDPGISPVFEQLYVAKRLLLASAAGCRIHFSLLSEAKSIAMIREAKRRGIPVTCGSSPLYFSMTENDLIYRGSVCKTDPPLRSEKDRQAVIEGIADGTIDCICSGHTPLSAYEKQGGIRKALPGAATLETVFSAGMTYLVESGAISFSAFLHCLTAAPAALLGKKAAVAEGEPGDLVLLDPDAEVIFSDSTMKSRARNTPFLGMALRGRVDGLLLDGRFAYRFGGR